MINRREFLTLAASGAITMFGSTTFPFRTNSHAYTGQASQAQGEADLIINMKSKPGQVPIYSGPKTGVWKYSAEFLKGNPDSITNMGDGSYLGPIIRAKKGQRIQINFQNELPASSIIHWHGLHVPEDMDGHPMHLHGAHFRVIERRGISLDGYVDEGWKDTVSLMPGERIRLHVRFGDHPGLFLYHCHNLEHGDAGMMRNYLIRGNPASTSGFSAT